MRFLSPQTSPPFRSPPCFTRGSSFPAPLPPYSFRTRVLTMKLLGALPLLVLSVFILCSPGPANARLLLRQPPVPAPDGSVPPEGLAGENGQGRPTKPVPARAPNEAPRRVAIAFITIAAISALIAVLACVWCCILRPERTEFKKSPAVQTKKIPLPPPATHRRNAPLSGSAIPADTQQSMF